MEVKSLIRGHKTRGCWRRDSNQDSQIPTPHSQPFLHNTGRQPRGRNDMGPGRQRRTPRKIHGGKAGYPRDRRLGCDARRGRSGRRAQASGASLGCLNLHGQQGARERGTGKQHELHFRKRTVTLPFTMDRTFLWVEY